ncbi:MAG: sn-glycerol-3-phosphate ABC transporter ATP-binding protein UgpC [Gemmatimonadaceae bacterium]
MARVKLEQVSKIYSKGRSPAAVDRVDLDVAHGEFVVLVGPSGCGKSTTLRMIAGLESITSGQLWIGDRVVNEVPPNERDIAMVFQSYALYPHMTVRENLAFALKLRKLPAAEIDRRVREAAAVLEIEDLLERRPKQLSGGQRQRVAVGRAIVREPEVFLFDEPLSNLDAALRVQTRRELSRLHRRLGATMIYVTHDQVEAMTLGDRIVVMQGGKVMQIGTPTELYERPANRFVGGFIGSPAMTFIPGRIDRDAGTVVGTGVLALTLMLPNGYSRTLASAGAERVDIGLRPEHVALAPPTRESGWSYMSLPVDLVESVGNEALVYLALGAGHLAARADPHRAPAVGDIVEIGLDMRRAQYFSAETGQRISTDTVPPEAT